MKKILYFLLSLITCAAFAVGASACRDDSDGDNAGDNGNTNTEQPGDNTDGDNTDDGSSEGQTVQLTAPTVLLDGNRAYWSAVENASGYKYKIGESGEEKPSTNLFVNLTHAQTVYVKALGDGKEYSDSAWSVGVTYTASPLSAPEVKIEGNVAKWSAIDGAVSYAYKINDGEEKNTTDLSVILEQNDKIVVKAIGNGATALDSAWSVERTYRINALTIPTIKLEGNVASWAAIDNAVSYVYKIGETGEEQAISGTSITLFHAQTLYVKAVGDNIYHLDSDWSIGATYNAPQLKKPQFTFTGGVLSWGAIDGAVAYEYKFTLNETPQSMTETSITLTKHCTIYVRAVGDNKTCVTGLWGTFKYEPKKLTVAQGSVHLNSSTGLVEWTKCQGSIRYDYKIGEDGEVQNGGREGSLTLTDGQTIYFKAIGDGVNYTDSDWFRLQYTSSGGSIDGYA